MNIKADFFISPINFIFKNGFLPSLTYLQRKISHIASVAIKSLSACYSSCLQYLRLKVKFTHPRSTPINLRYTPQKPNRPARINQDSLCVQLLNPENPPQAAPLYEVNIQKFTNFPLTSNFKIKDYNINNEIVEFLIECHHSSNPKIEGYWDEEQRKVFLIGGAANSSAEPNPNSEATTRGHFYWLRLDLDKIPTQTQGPIHIAANSPKKSVHRPEGYAEESLLTYIKENYHLKTHLT